MMPSTLVRTGAVGAAGTAFVGALPVLALCCASPAASLALGTGAGLASAVVGPEWLGLLILPLMGFLALLAYGHHRETRLVPGNADSGLETSCTTCTLPKAG